MTAAPREALTVSDIYITEELERRSPTKIDVFQEKRALQDLAAHMVDRPDEVLPRFVGLAMEMTGGISAGLSLYEENPFPGVFRWRYLRGTLAPFEEATTPRNFSPCGITLDRNAPVLSRHPERIYDWISDANIIVPEVLLVPLYLGGGEPLGTLWIVSETEGHFDSGHARAMTELAAFVGLALRMLNTEKKLKDALDLQETLTMEMGHRVKNLFAVTSGLIRASEKAASTPEEMSQILGGRLHALAEATALVSRSFNEGVSPKRTHLGELAEKIMRPHASPGGNDRFIANGPVILLGERATNGIALVLHELATNALKYGALHTENGIVELVWRIEDASVKIEWIESGGKSLQPPENFGFGTRLSRSTIVGQFHGELDYDWRPTGLVVSMTLPAGSLAR